MHITNLLVVATGLIVGTAATPVDRRSDSDDSAITDQTYITNVLKAHNTARAANGPVPDLTWDSTLSSGAHQWANHLCANPDPATGRIDLRPSGYLENLAMRYGGNVYPAAITADINSWISQGSFYNPSDPLGSRRQASPWTQVVWKSTTKVGCATANCRLTSWYITVCRYDPRGNSGGASSYDNNVFKGIKTITRRTDDSTAITDQTYITNVLKAHNTARAANGPVPDLTWEPTLSAGAHQRANYLCANRDPATGKIDLKRNDLDNFGENIAITNTRINNAYPAAITSDIRQWTKGVSLYNPSDPLGSSKQTDHWTQVVWKSTTKVGCATSTCKLTDLGVWQYITVCRYDQRGNIPDQYAANVFKGIKKIARRTDDSAITDQTYIDNVMKAHNDARAANGPVPDLIWEPSLSASAHQRANYFCAKSDSQTGPNRFPVSRQGENFLQRFGGKNLYPAGIRGDINIWKQTPFWTQVLWKYTTKVGCATSTCKLVSPGLWEYYTVCHYDPPGNNRDQSATNGVKDIKAIARRTDDSAIIDQTYINSVMKAHNDARAANGPVPNLTWDSALSAGAHQWANYLCTHPDSGQISIRHSDAVALLGENLALDNYASVYTAVTGHINRWTAQGSLYNPSNPLGNRDRTGDFTQVVWKSTTRVGCATAACKPISSRLWTYITVCRYTPRGNVLDQNQGASNYDTNVFKGIQQ